MATDQEIDSILATIRTRESNGNYTVKNKFSSASGAYQYIDKTWTAWRDRAISAGNIPPEAAQYAHAADAPSWMQDKVARQNVQSILDSAGGRIDAVPRAWYTGDPNADLNSQPRGAGNEGTTVGRYVNGWMNTYNKVTNGEIEVSATGGSGGTMGTPSAATADTNVSPEQYAMEHYGYMAAFLQHPELGPILQQAAREQWSQDRLKGAVTATDWWHSTNESARQWMSLSTQDPAEAESRTNAQALAIMARANQLGMPINRDRANVIAGDSLKFGWQGAELDRAIGMDAGQAQLIQSGFGTTLKAKAKSYGIQLSDAALGDWARRIAGGDDTEENFTTYAREQAMQLYPTIAGYLQAGGTTEAYFDPYKQRAAQVLNINPEEIDISDPKWSGAFSTPDNTGVRRSLNMDEWNRQLMTDDRYGFKYTENAQNMAEDFVGGIKRQMGITK